MDIVDVIRQVRSGKAFITVASAEEKQALMDMCAQLWRPTDGCSARSWGRYCHLISDCSCSAFSCKSAEDLIAEGMTQYLFSELVERPIEIDASTLL